jgi:magnesium transporter
MLAAIDPDAPEQLSLEDLQDAWSLLVLEDRVDAFRALERTEAEDLFLGLSSHDQSELLQNFPPNERRSWFRLLAPDDAADLIQEVSPEERDELLTLLDEQTRRDVVALLAYAEDDAGGLMNPRYARVRPEITADEAITYLRRQAAERTESLPYAYVLDHDQRLRGVVSYRELFAAKPGQRVEEIMATDVVSVPEAMDQEEVSQLFATTRLLAVPVVDAAGRMKGIVTLDDVVDVVREEATEDIQKMGGTAVLEAPYLQVSPFGMSR